MECVPRDVSAATTIELHQSALTRRDFPSFLRFFLHFFALRMVKTVKTASFQPPSNRSWDKSRKTCRWFVEHYHVMHSPAVLPQLFLGEYLLFRLKGFLLAGLIIILHYENLFSGNCFHCYMLWKHKQTTVGGSTCLLNNHHRPRRKSGSGKQSNLLKHTFR